MFKHVFSKKFLICLAAAALFGCSEDSENQPCQCEQCPSCKDKEDCSCDKNCSEQPDTPEQPDPPVIPGCSDNECMPGNSKCDDKNVVICKADENGCGHWGEPETCPDKQYCREQTQKCQYACGDECEPFSLVMIPDTQYYTLNSCTFDYTSPDSSEPMGAYDMQMKWIVDHANEYNIKMVHHLGDITDGNENFQWQIASQAHELLDKAEIPYTIATGNHDYIDYDSTSRNQTHFLEYFNNARFMGKDWFHGFVDGANSYATFEVGDLKFLVLALEFAPRKEILCWANEVIANHKDRYVIITSHSILLHHSGVSNTPGYETVPNYDSIYCSGNFANVYFGASGNSIFEELSRRHSNVILTVSGHVPDSEFRTKKGLNGNSFAEMLVDYQTERHCLKSPCTNSCGHNGADTGNGWMRLVTFDPMQLDPGKNNVTTKSVSAMENAKNADGTPYFPDNPDGNHKYDRLSFYCSDILAKENIDSGKEVDNHYPASAENEIHNPSFSVNLTDPIEYQYSDGGFNAFYERDVNTSLAGEQDVSRVASNPKTGTFVVVWQDDSSIGDDPYPDSGSSLINYDIEARLFYSGGCAKSAQFTVNQNTIYGSNQITPDVAMSEKGDFAVVWADINNNDNNKNDDYEIWMRIFDTDGFAYKFKGSDGKVKEYILVNQVFANKQIHPAISTSPSGDIVVVWEDYASNPERPQIYARGFKMDGTENFPQFNVSSSGDGSNKNYNTNPDVAVANDGSFIVTWEKRYEPANAETDISKEPSDIIVKTFNKNGSVRIVDAVVNSMKQGPQIQPAVAVNSNGDYYVSYSDDEDQNGFFRVKTVGYNKEGKIIRNDDYVSAPGEDAIASDICMDDKGNIGFTWEARAFNEGDVRRVTLNKNGELGNTATVHSWVNGPHKSPATACTPDGQQIITWTDGREHSTKHDHYFKVDNKTEILVRGYDL